MSLDDVHDCLVVFVTDTPVTPVTTQLETSASASRYGRITDGFSESRYGRTQVRADSVNIRVLVFLAQIVYSEKHRRRRSR